MYKNVIKRLLDFLIALTGFIILSPIYLMISICIKCSSPGPIHFKQERVGQNEQLFTILKFRTMKIDTPKDVPTHLLENPESYITGIGKFMRKTSLDELPQIINIIKGDMSIIGPRPSLAVQEDLNSLRRQNGSHLIKPGLTGLAQIKGRDELPIDVKAKYDGEYAQKVTFSHDVKIFFGTILSVAKSDGVQEGKQ